jgi:CxxC-x17-CxxC domain-containing protein
MKFGKAKVAESSAAVQSGLAEIAAIVMRISERLDILEKKTDLVISQTSVRSFGGREHSKPAQQPFVPAQPFRQPGPSQQRSNEVKPVQSQPLAHKHQRPERVLHKAVCADCQKDCEIPFKPTLERPVYCKECFSKRKSGNSSKGNNENTQVPNLPEEPGPVNPPQRQVVVTKKGVGKVTVSEIVRSPARDHSPKNKSHKPAPKSKR